MVDLYEILGIAYDASDEEIRKSYRTLARKYHPDIYAGDKEYAESKMKRINTAYEILSNPVKRKKYDEMLEKEWVKKYSQDKSTDQYTQSTPYTNQPPQNQYEPTQKQPHQYSSNNNPKSIPIFLRWWVIAIVYCTGIGSWIAIFLTIWRLLYNRKHPECRLLKKARVVLSGAGICFAVLCVIACFIPNDQSDIEDIALSANNSSETSTPVNKVEPDDKEFTHNETVTSETQAVVIDNNNLYDSADNELEKLEVPDPSHESSALFTNVQDLFQSADSNKTTSKISEFGKPKYLDKIDVDTVAAINGNNALVVKRDGNKSYYVCYNISREKENFTVSNYPKTEGFEKGYIASTFLEWPTSNIHRLTDMNNNVIYEQTDGDYIRAVMYDKEMYLLKKEVETYSFSGREYALFDFDGNTIIDWTQDHESDEWEVMGDGIFYLPDSKVFLDIYTGETFEWPDIYYEGISSSDESKVDQITLDLRTNGYGAPTGYPTMKLTDFNKDRCLLYFEGIYIGDPAVFYSIDRLGNHKVINEVYNKQEVSYVEANNTFYYSTYNNSLIREYYEDVQIYDMYGNLAYDLTGLKVINYSVNENSVAVVLHNVTGGKTEYFYALVDQNGNMLFEPKLVTDKIYETVPDTELFYIADNENLTVYDYSGNVVGVIDPIKIKEKQLIFSKNRVYNPISLEVWGDYYVVRCKDLDDIKYRSFIGKLS